MFALPARGDVDQDEKLMSCLQCWCAGTSVEVEYAGGKLVSLTVEPARRKSAVKFAACVTV